MTRSLGATGLVLAIGATTWGSATARAQPVAADPVALEVSGCPDPEAVRAAARVELAGADAAVARVAVVCLGASRVLVVAFPRGADRPAAREIVVDDVDAGSRARAVAIALAELMRGANDALAPAGPVAPPAAAVSSAAPVAPGPSPPSPPTVVFLPWPAPPSPASEPPPAVVDRWTAGASLRSRAYSAVGTVAIGPTVEVDAPLARSSLRLRGAAQLGISGAERAVGTASITSWTGAVSVVARAASEPVALDVGPVLEIGAATSEGTPAAGPSIESTTTTAPVVMAGGQVVLATRLATIVVPFVGVDAGAVVTGITADVDGDRVLSLAGAFLGVRVGLSLGPDAMPAAAAPGDPIRRE